MNDMNAIAKKLQIKANQTWLILDAPEDYLATLEPLPDGVALTFSIEKPIDGIQLFVKNSKELAAGLAALSAVIKPETVLWVIYPKKRSGIDTDLEMMGSWDTATQYGLRPVTSAAINNVWTALRFKPETLVKQSNFSNKAVKQNDHSAYIDPVNKAVTLPQDVAEALAAKPETAVYFNSLAYTHRKEYIVWILSAKQEQTRSTRITKMLEMLLNGKKNPSEK